MMTMTGFTPLNTQHCILNESRIDLWQFSLEHELNNVEQFLDTDEQARACRFYFSHHKRRFATARATLKIILGHYLNSAPDRLVFTYNNHGKPEVINTQKLQFNLSHSGDLAMLAVGARYPLGVDIERYSARPYEGIAKDMFSEQEIERFTHTPKALKPAVFFHIWSQKEALIKACGLGLSYPTKEFSVPTNIPVKQLIEDPLHNTTWKITTFMPKAAYSGALCANPSIREIRHGIISIRQDAQLRF
jgi:4'-phosphopantetheinyl transferase